MNTEKRIPKILIGNTFPLTLVRGRDVIISPSDIETLKMAMAEADEVVSFWGHANTAEAASASLGINITPNRAALTLSEDHRPKLGEDVFDDVWVVSPDYVPGFRPAIGVEVQPEQILGWQVLRVRF